MEELYDFGGYATRNDIRCADGRVIRQNAFAHQDGEQIPLVYMHDHKDIENVIGHGILENRPDGVYVYGKLNNTEKGKIAKELVRHGDLDSLSVWANNLDEKQRTREVYHGDIKEVSLVLAGANPGAFIDSLSISHSDEPSLDEGIITSGMSIELGVEMTHSYEKRKESDKNSSSSAKKEPNVEPEEPKESDETIEAIVESMSEKQKNTLFYLMDQVDKNNKKEREIVMKHNIFENNMHQDIETPVLSHSDIEGVFKDAKRLGSLKESVLSHAADYGIDNIDYLFPEAKSLNNPPEWIKRPDGWVSDVMNDVHHTPFSRIKSVFADITEDDARARGYIKGKLKKEEVFTLLKRSTTPTTIYKKQKLDRDDIIDITEFDVVAWLKMEMRMMLDEEIARAILIGDGRLNSSDDKISEDHIRPVYKDHELYSYKVKVDIPKSATDDAKAKAFIRAAIKYRKDYRGSGNPKLYTTEDMLTNMLLLEDNIGHTLYKDEVELARKLRVSKIVTVPVMENLVREGDDGEKLELAGIIVNLRDYNVGADKGGAVSMFDDFDIDYNQQKYLIETRCSGALTKPKSAMVLEFCEAQA